MNNYPRPPMASIGRRPSSSSQPGSQLQSPVSAASNFTPFPVELHFDYSRSPAGPSRPSVPQQVIPTPAQLQAQKQPSQNLSPQIQPQQPPPRAQSYAQQPPFPPPQSQLPRLPPIHLSQPPNQAQSHQRAQTHPQPHSIPRVSTPTHPSFTIHDQIESITTHALSKAKPTFEQAWALAAQGVSSELTKMHTAFQIMANKDRDACEKALVDCTRLRTERDTARGELQRTRAAMDGMMREREKIIRDNGYLFNENHRLKQQLAELNKGQQDAPVVAVETKDGGPHERPYSPHMLEDVAVRVASILDGRKSQGPSDERSKLITPPQDEIPNKVIDLSSPAPSSSMIKQEGHARPEGEMNRPPKRLRLEEEERRPARTNSAGSRSGNEERKRVGIAHMNLLFQQTTENYLCKLCAANRKQAKRFPVSASWTELVGHLEESHAEACSKLANKSPIEVAEMVQRLDKAKSKSMR